MSSRLGPLPRASLSRRVFVGALLASTVGCRGSEAGETEVTIAAAASLRGSMPELVDRFHSKRPGVKVAVTYGASGDLQKQVEGGAPIDAVVFAARGPVDELVKKGLVDEGSVAVVAHNTLVLVGPKRRGPDAPPPLTFATLERIGEGDHVAIGDPGAVPAGRYAQTALERLGEWRALQGKIVFGGDVGAVLQYARRGEVVAAVVYATEARGVSDIEVLDVAKGEWAPRPEVVSGIV
ncbi:MAG TPA: molybdate ABC transporter substrate-binding protein, partial [Polyangiaceae bacterium]|nr:molybdate ABC transporter substrate-binding protein [Polyangiaceae bacterium]